MREFDKTMSKILEYAFRNPDKEEEAVRYMRENGSNINSVRDWLELQEGLGLKNLRDEYAEKCLKDNPKAKMYFYLWTDALVIPRPRTSEF